MQRTLLLGCAALALAIASPVMAAEDAGDLSAGETTSGLVSDTGAGSPDRAVTSVQSVSVDAGQGSGQVFVQLTADNFWLKLSAAADSSGNGVLATLDGFGDATAVEAGYTGVFGHVPRLSDEQRDVCDDIDRAEQCDEDLAAKGTPAQREAWRKASRKNRINVYLWGVTGKVGTQSFDYFEPVTFAAQSEDRTPWSASAYIYGQPFNDPTSVTLRYEYQETFTASPKQTICPGGPPVCLNGPIGAPVRSEAQLASLEVRRRWDFQGPAWLNSVGIDARVTYDFEADVTGVDVPVYFIQDKGLHLTAGLRFGWRDDTNDTTVSLFVTKPVSFLGN